MATATTVSVEKVLNKQVANFGVLYIKLHNYHWYVKGQQFFTLHVKFEELYDEATLHLDAIAERLLTLGGSPVATMQQMVQEASIKEAAGREKAEEMVRHLIEDFNTINKELQEGMEAAEQSGDESTSDMLLGIKSSLEKHTWMLKSFLGS
ncbi:DNA starvation/stationary phase protection protein [Paenibacillus doosanensis]|uniref:Dps family protein n=1 Tax=Paenibacillus doosanensis TaxID=1229154 RepID=UPI00217F976E|nr:DNA starvation/stationary phase protection protein [Paenibacillus doosanensis]MCS7459538.1 DNA starvation/stationary phase protection protein [Paenibacillus doosanensis]